MLHRTCRFIPLAIAALAATGATTLQAQSGTHLVVGGGYATARAEGGERWESGPELGIGVRRDLNRRLGVELRLATTVFATAVAVADCLPGATCLSHIVSPGSITSVTGHLVVRPVPHWSLLAGVGHAWAGDPGVGPTAEHTSAFAVSGGVRLTPFAGGRRGPALEVRSVRYSRNIGSLTWVVAPGISWTF